MEPFINLINIEISGFLILIISFLISFIILPKLIDVINFKQLMDHPNSRSSHTNKTPTLGGLVFYVSAIFSLFFIRHYDIDDISFNIIVSLTVLFIVGLKDDLVVLSARTKVIAQLIATTFILLKVNMYIVDLHGFMMIDEIHLMISLGLGYSFILFIINAYNLIDGIDGLAAMMGIVVFVIYATFFYSLQLDYYFLLSMISIGFLIAFLRFNISKENKIFMGDTGSMIVGFLIGVQTLRFLSLEVIELQEIYISPKNIFLVVLSILFFPTIDVIRVIIVRLMNKRGPFAADRSHMHHVLVDKGLSHVKASATIVANSILIFFIIFFINTYVTTLFLILVFSILTVFTFYVLVLLDVGTVARTYRKKIKSYFPRLIIFTEFRIRKITIFTLKSLFYRGML